MFETVRDGVFPFMKTLGGNGGGESGSTYSHHMKDAFTSGKSAFGLKGTRAKT